MIIFVIQKNQLWSSRLNKLYGKNFEREIIWEVFVEIYEDDENLDKVKSSEGGEQFCFIKVQEIECIDLMIINVSKKI